jgi:XTP/dITP diphosphohydrolase
MPTGQERANSANLHSARQIVLASSNPGKVREISELLYGLDTGIIPQSEFTTPDIDESGLTFVENAILKARNAAHYCGLPSIADDSGLEVDALNGAPGIYSSRYAGINATDEDNVQKLLTDLGGVPEYRRSARFQCVMVYMAHEFDPTPVICQGTWEGSILFAPRGTNGFGYDPIFYVPTHYCSSAELPAEVKNLISHRAQALRKLIAALRACNPLRGSSE